MERMLLVSPMLEMRRPHSDAPKLFPSCELGEEKGTEAYPPAVKYSGVSNSIVEGASG